MIKFGQAEYCDFIVKMFADKLDKILEEKERKNFNSKNTEDILREFPSSKDVI